MRRATPKLRDFAVRLIGYETRRHGTSDDKVPSARLASERLRPHLSKFMGNIGFNALLSRALVLGIADVPWLSSVRVKTDGSLEGFEGLSAQIAPEEFTEGCVTLFSHLLGLLAAFIGEELTLRLVSEAWPELSPIELDFGKGDKNEKAN